MSSVSLGFLGFLGDRFTDPILLVFLAIIAIAWLIKFATRPSGKIVKTFEGQVTALQISLIKHVRLKGRDENFSVRPVVRLTDGREWLGPWVTTTEVPRNILKQVFAHPTFINQLAPRLNLSRDENQAALEQARVKNGHYTFHLSRFHPVTVGENEKGRPFVQGWEKFSRWPQD